MSSALDLREGAIFEGQFRVVRPLARGGMGAVYVVEQIATKRERALKLMHPMLVSDERSRERFEREAQVSARIDSDHVVEVIAAGIEKTSGTPWLCMELLKGEELGKRMERGPLTPAETLEIARQLGHALGAAHRAGIVHRDLKPENLFLAVPRREGVPFTLKVLDFGVAALVHEASGQSKATQGVGSPLWMAPEQTNVGNVQPATDVWAVGLLAYHFLTGGFYWKAASTEGSTITALLVEVMVEPLVPASTRAAEQGRAHLLPRGFDAWFARCVAREPRERFPEAGAAIAELVAILSGNTPSLAPATAPQAFAATMAAPSTSPFGGATGPPAAAPFPPTGMPHGVPPMPPTGMPHGVPPMPPTGPMPPMVTGAPPRRSPWPLVLGAMLVGVLLCGGGTAYLLYRGATTVAESVRHPHIDLTGENGEHITFGPEGASVTLPDGGVLMRTDPSGHPIVEIPPIPGLTGLPSVPGVRVAEPAEEAPAEPAEEAPAEPEEEGDDAEAAPARARRPRASARASPMGRLLRARLDRCVRGNLEGEPPARWTFTLNFNRFGTADSARIVGPHAGEPGGAYGTFRRCVQNDVAGFDSGGDPGPFTLTLP